MGGVWSLPSLWTLHRTRLRELVWNQSELAWGQEPQTNQLPSVTWWRGRYSPACESPPMKRGTRACGREPMSQTISHHSPVCVERKQGLPCLSAPLTRVSTVVVCVPPFSDAKGTFQTVYWLAGWVDSSTNTGLLWGVCLSASNRFMTQLSLLDKQPKVSRKERSYLTQKRTPGLTSGSRMSEGRPHTTQPLR